MSRNSPGRKLPTPAKARAPTVAIGVKPVSRRVLHKYFRAAGIEAMQRELVCVRPNKRMVQAVSEGISVDAVTNLVKWLRVDQRRALDLLAIPKSTYIRRVKSPSARLGPEESDRMARFARLSALAVSLMEGDEDEARRWLETPDEDLDSQTPLEYSKTETGFREVERLIHRIEQGVYS